MGEFVYPNAWWELSQVPSARSELLSFVRDVVQWNDDDSHVKKNGADDLLGFLYDYYCVNEGSNHLVGQLIFPDELNEFEGFIEAFDKFLSEWRKRGKDMARLHEADMPHQVIKSANTLLHKLEERGIPEWRE